MHSNDYLLFQKCIWNIIIEIFVHPKYFTTTRFIIVFEALKHTCLGIPIILTYHQQDNDLILNIWCRWYNIYIEDNPRKALLPLMEILLCNIHITICCISCNHHNFAARLFIPLGKRDAGAHQPLRAQCTTNSF